jgi:hypothetical protein
MDNPYFSGNTMIMTEKKFSYDKLYTADRIYTFRNDKTYEILDAKTDQITR